MYLHIYPNMYIYIYIIYLHIYIYMYLLISTYHISTYHISTYISTYITTIYVPQTQDNLLLSQLRKSRRHEMWVGCAISNLVDWPFHPRPSVNVCYMSAMMADYQDPRPIKCLVHDQGQVLSITPSFPTSQGLGTPRPKMNRWSKRLAFWSSAILASSFRPGQVVLGDAVGVMGMTMVIACISWDIVWHNPYKCGISYKYARITGTAPWSGCCCYGIYGRDMKRYEEISKLIKLDQTAQLDDC